MALNLVKATMLTRTKGNSTIDHAAYIDREKYRDEKTAAYTKNYENEGEIEWKAVWLPKDAPEWMRDPQKLWNELEKREDQHKRHASALLSRSWIMTIPNWEGQTLEDRIRMAKDILREFTRDGWVCQAAIHATDKDTPNPHLHIQSPMRYVTKEGFGGRREANDDGRYASKKDELKHWKDRWSEIGAQHLERAGFPLEAQRFRAGYLSREEKLNEALDRGDKPLADKLEDRPHIHMGPSAYYMENKKGVETHKGDQNRAIDEYNLHRQVERDTAREKGWDAPDNLRGTAREIWWAYNGTTNAHEMKHSLEERGFAVARITKEDAKQSAVEFAAEQKGKYVPRYKEGEYVVVDDRDRVYRLNEQTTGDKPWKIPAVMRPLDRTNVQSLSEARALMQDRTAIRDKDRQSMKTLLAIGTLRKERAQLGPEVRRAPAREVAARSVAVGRGVTRTVERTVGSFLSGLANAVVPTLTPEQKLDGKIADEARREAGDEAEARRRRENQRER